MKKNIKSYKTRLQTTRNLVDRGDIDIKVGHVTEYVKIGELFNDIMTNIPKKKSRQ